MRTRLLKMSFLLILVLSSPVLSEELQVTVSVNQQLIQLGQSIDLYLKIEGTMDVPPPELKIKNFFSEYSGYTYGFSSPSKGRIIPHIRLIYTLTPKKVGKLEIPSLDVNVLGEIYQTSSIQITVEENHLNLGKLDQLCFVETSLDRDLLYLNEKSQVLLDLYISKNVEYKKIKVGEPVKNNDYITQPFEKMSIREVEMDGNYYNLITYGAIIQPIRVGKFEMEPIQVEVEMGQPVQSSDDLLANLISNGYNYEIFQLETSTRLMEAIPLPPGQPESFRGAIGQFALSVQGPAQVQVGEPFKVDFKISGSGNFNTVSAPIFDQITHFKYYEPQVVQDVGDWKTKVGEKRFERTLLSIESDDGSQRIVFSYFDPLQQRYITLEKSLYFQVLAGEESPGKVSNFIPDEEFDIQGNLFGVQIFFASFMGWLRYLIKMIKEDLVSWLFFFLAFFTGWGTFVWWKNTHSSELNEGELLVKQTLRNLQGINELIVKGINREIYNLLCYEMQNYFKERFNLILTGISNHELEVLEKGGIPKGLIQQIGQLLHTIDQIQFASWNIDETDMRNLVMEAQHIIILVNECKVQSNEKESGS